MDNSRCRALVECADRGSVTAAAESLGYTPSAVSQLISGLEEELGLKLLIRSSKGVRLTAEGEVILPKVRNFLAREKEIYQTADELRGVTSGSLSLAVYPSVAITWLPAIVRRFKNDYPGIHIDIMEGIRSDIYSNLNQSKADLAILAYSEPMPYEWTPLAETSVVAALPEDHPLAGLDKFPVEECENYDFILGSWGKEQEIINILDKYELHPNIKYTTYDTPATLAMVRMGLGISFVNELSSRVWNEHLVKLPLDPSESVSFGIAVLSSEHMTSAARKFVDYAIEFFKE
ncbi:MAG: LysR family transcriptional regulator [Mogibacterium sp.]|nr:LysR family transcriptional regulator [Mogibacterium sp.]